jgi:hypothetical protein
MRTKYFSLSSMTLLVIISVLSVNAIKQNLILKTIAKILNDAIDNEG